MATIAEENKKILRQALDVIVGTDIPFEEVTTVTASDNYTGGSGIINGNPQKPTLMDLSGDGFQNDGLAIPLDDNTDGYISKIETPLNLTITLSSATSDDLIIIGYLDGSLHKWRFSGSGATRSVTIPANVKRIIITRIVCGEAFWFDNNTLVSCNLQLRAVETKVDNPELQMSEIEIEGYEPDDITDKIGYIGTGFPIYYTAGYPGDMSPLRKFYLGEPIEIDDKLVKIKGYDATMFLDEDFEGAYVTGGINGYAEWFSVLLTNSGVIHEYTNDNSSIGQTTGGRFLPNNQTKRKVISDMVNLFRYGPFEDIGTEGYQVYVNYVDAGIPKLKVGKSSKITTIENTTKPKASVEPVIKTIEFNNYVIDINSSATIETVTVTGIKFGETSEPYYSFSTSSGTITNLSPYKYKVTANGSATISGRKFDFMPPYPEPQTFLPFEVSNDTNGITVTLEDFYGEIGEVRSTFLYSICLGLLERSNILYEFTFRGDPKLQPRDYIRVDTDGSGTLTEMTIDTIEIKHEGGGTTSTITARKGLI